MTDSIDATKGQLNPTIVSAVGISVNSETQPDMAKACEKAMSDEVLRCMEAGITDPAEQKRRMMEAHDRVVETWNK